MTNGEFSKNSPSLQSLVKNVSNQSQQNIVNLVLERFVMNVITRFTLLAFLSSHTRIPIAKKRENQTPVLPCGKHNKQNIFYCKEEKELFCSVCIPESHKDHATLSLTEYSAMIREEIREYAAMDESYPQAIIQKLKKENQELLEIVQQNESEIQKAGIIQEKMKVGDLFLSKSIEDIRDEVLVSKAKVVEIKKLIREVEKESLDDRLGEYLYMKAMKLMKHSRPDQVAPLLIESAKAGFLAAKLKLSIFVGQPEMGPDYRGDFRSKEVLAELKSSYDWFEKRAKSNDGDDLCNLGFWWETLGMDEGSMVAYYTRAADQGFALGQLHLGRCCEYGIGAHAEWHRAYHFYELAADQGLLVACAYLGNLYRADYLTSKEYYEATLENGYFGIYLNLAILAEEHGHHQDALEYLEKAASLGVFGAYRHLGEFYLHGKQPVEKDLLTAVKYFEMGLDAGEDTKSQLGLAYHEIGENHSEGFNGFPKNENLALRAYQLSVDFGSGSKELLPGYIYGSRVSCRSVRDCCISLLLSKRESSLLHPQVWDVVVLSLLEHQINQTRQ